MSVFRNSFVRFGRSIVPHPIREKMFVPIVDKAGVDRFVLETQDVSCLSIPKPSEYTLEMLLAAGVPLNEVNPLVVDTVPTDVQISQNVDKVLNSVSSNNNEVNE